MTLSACHSTSRQAQVAKTGMLCLVLGEGSQRSADAGSPPGRSCRSRGRVHRQPHIHARGLFQFATLQMQIAFAGQTGVTAEGGDIVVAATGTFFTPGRQAVRGASLRLRTTPLYTA